mmetsp:Transcript_35513/g.93808  ORF Transcript_35513/g.93808 Transcript_35513/m.93808 type:complete len:308 (-) Transcript_35513:1468-2391(-)
MAESKASGSCWRHCRRSWLLVASASCPPRRRRPWKRAGQLQGDIPRHQSVPGMHAVGSEALACHTSSDCSVPIVFFIGCLRWQTLWSWLRVVDCRAASVRSWPALLLTSGFRRIHLRRPAAQLQHRRAGSAGNPEAPGCATSRPSLMMLSSLKRSSFSGPCRKPTRSRTKARHARLWRPQRRRPHPLSYPNPKTRSPAAVGPLPPTDSQNRPMPMLSSQLWATSSACSAQGAVAVTSAQWRMGRLLHIGARWSFCWTGCIRSSRRQHRACWLVTTEASRRGAKAIMFLLHGGANCDGCYGYPRFHAR